MTQRPNFLSMASDFSVGRRNAQDLVEQCLRRIADPNGEGDKAFLKTYESRARAEAAEIDKKRRDRLSVPPFAGIPISIKDLFDVAGDVTTAGSVALGDAAPAAVDCPVVERMRRAGFIIVGRTNMTEFAYSGLGVNPHFSTPRNPWERDRGRIPGGSSSGAAISVTDGMAYCGLGSDTGGSCRIPAALTGLVGWKPTASRIPLEGVLPLSFSLDSVGCMATNVDDCAITDAIMAGATSPAAEPSYALTNIRLMLPQTVVTDHVDAAVGAAFERALSQIASSGTTIENRPLVELADIAQINAKGGFTAAESYAWHRALLERRPDDYDPRVRMRILRGREQTAADYIDSLRGRAALIAGVNDRMAGFDALVMPTVPVVAPLLSGVEADDDYARLNLLMLRNPTIANMLDGCSISVPIHEDGSAPVGLMLIAPHGADRKLLSIGKAIAALFRG